jgi:hypothetical protein
MSTPPSAPIFLIDEKEEDFQMYRNTDPAYKIETVTLHELQTNERHKNRPVRDIPCFVLFYLALSLVSYAICIAYTYGEPSSLPMLEFSTIDINVMDFTTSEIAMLKHDALYLFIGLLITILLAVGWFELLKRVSFYIVYGLVALCTLLLLSMGLYLYFASHRYLRMELQGIAVLCFVGTGALLLAGYFMKRKLDFTIEVMTEAGAILSKMPELYAVGLTIGAIYFGIIAIMISSLIYLFSIPSASILMFNSEESVFMNYIFDGSYRHFFWIMLFGGLWLISVIGFIEQYIIASVVYRRMELVHGLRTKDNHVLRRAVMESLTKSFGSLAFGSFLVAVAWFLGIFSRFEFIKGKIPWRNYFITRVLFDVFTFILEWISEYAIIYVALTGQSFLQSTKEVVTLLKEEISQTIVTGLIVNFVLMIGKLTCTILVTFLVIGLIDLKHSHISTVTLLTLATITYLLFNLLSKIYTVACSTILIYTLTDIIKNKDSKEFKSPEKLRNIILINKLQI